jgi:hypothetical protein
MTSLNLETIKKKELERVQRMRRLLRNSKMPSETISKTLNRLIDHERLQGQIEKIGQFVINSKLPGEILGETQIG